MRTFCSKPKSLKWPGQHFCQENKSPVPKCEKDALWAFISLLSPQAELNSHLTHSADFNSSRRRVCAIYLPTGIATCGALLLCMCACVCRQFQSVVALLAVNDSLSVNSSGSECKCPCAHHRVHVPASAKPWIYFSWQPLKPYNARPDDHYSCMGI